ncbi:MAG: aldo/keto reductase [Gammaproteobacteria bacterium]
MNKRRLGSTDCFVSALGLGTVKIGRNTQVKYPEAFRIPDDRSVRDLLELAQHLGINLIDTAPAYGTSEERLGELLPGNRADWHIVTKVGEEFVDEHSHFDFTPEHTQKSIERSLKRLNTDYLDTVLVHSDGNDVHIIEHFGVLEVLADLKKAGIIRSFGMSTKTLEGGLLALEHSDVVMATYNLETQDDLPILEEAQKKQKGILIKKALASGHASTSLESSLRFVFDAPGVTSVILGTINPVHLKQNVDLLNKVLSLQRDSSSNLSE